MVLSSMLLQKVSVTLWFRRLQCLVLRSVLSVFINLRSAECVCSYYGLRVCSQTNKMKKIKWNGVQAKVKEHAPDAIFIHCYAHRLNLVLSQTASSNAKCNVFFSTLGGLSTFFTTSLKRMSLLDDVVKTRFPKLPPTTWSYSAQLVVTVQHNLEDLLQLFEHIVETPQSFD